MPVNMQNNYFIASLGISISTSPMTMFYLQSVIKLIPQSDKFMNILWELNERSHIFAN